jgi:hypothetical protein
VSFRLFRFFRGSILEDKKNHGRHGMAEHRKKLNLEFSPQLKLAFVHLAFVSLVIVPAEM